MCPYIYIFKIPVSTYGLLMAVGIAVTFLLAFTNGKKYNLVLDDMFIIMAFSLLFGLIGAALLNIAVSYNLNQIINIIKNGNFSAFGGLVFYGGLIGGVVGAAVGIKVAKVNTLTVEKAAVPFLPVGHAIGRVGCVMAGCCNGKKYSGVFAIYYPNSVAGLPPDQGYFPVQLLEAVINIIIALLLVKYSKHAKYKYSILGAYLLLYSVARFLLEFLRGDKVRGIYGGISTSQIISVAVFLLTVGYFITVYVKQKSLKR